MKYLIQAVLLSATVMVIATCSNSTEPEPNMPLNAGETEELLFGLMTVLTDTMPEIKTVHSETDFTIICPESGDARVQADVIESYPNDSTAVLTTELSFMPNECGLKGANETTFTLSAAKSLDYVSTLTIQGFFENIELDGNLEGQLDWTVKSRSGSCVIEMEVDFEVSEDLSEATSLLTGRACEHDLILDISEFSQTE